MHMSDSRTIAAPPEQVWAAILDPEVLKQCVPGCQEMHGSPEDGFEATVVQKVGPVKATFKGQVTEEQLNTLVAYIKTLGTADDPSAAGEEVADMATAEEPSGNE